MMEKVRRSGVYVLVNMRSWRSYIGMSVDVDRRRNQHRLSVNSKRTGKGATAYMQADSNRDFENTFLFCLLQETSDDKAALREAEKQWESRFNEADIPLYNAVGCGAGCGRHDEVTLQKISLAHKGKRLSQVTRHKISVARKGMRMPMTRGSLHHGARAVVNLTSGQLFSTVKEAEDACGVARGSIQKAIKQVRRANTFCWAYAEDREAQSMRYAQKYIGIPLHGGNTWRA